MDSNQKTGLIFFGLVILLITTVLITATISNIKKDQKITYLIVNGTEPYEARIAIKGVNNYNSEAYQITRLLKEIYKNTNPELNNTPNIPKNDSFSIDAKDLGEINNAVKQ